MELQEIKLKARNADVKDLRNVIIELCELLEKEFPESKADKPDKKESVIADKPKKNKKGG